MRRNHFFSALWAVAIGGVASCGDNTVSRTCGEGTTDVDGVCVADGGTCGPGTISVGGECVPDGSVICGDGTTYDATTGECVPDPSVCGPGLVLDPVTHQCVDEGVIAVDAEEAAEPNDGDAPTEIAGFIDVPAIGAEPFVIHGCVNPYRDVNGDGNPDIDFDYWVIDAAAPTALHIRADGVQGLAAGFVTLTGDEQLFNDGWQRFGVNLVDDTSERELYLPKAGIYVLAMTDSRSLFLDAAGGPDACYYTSIEQIALPAATPGTVTDTTGSDDGTLRVISFTPGEGDLFDNLLDDGGKAALAGGIVVLRDGTYAISAVETQDFFGPVPAETLAGGLSAGDTFEVVVDALYNYALTPQDYTLVTTQFAGQALPTDGSTITVTPNPPYFNFLYFDVGAAGEVDNFDVTFDRPLDFVRITDANLSVIANIAQGAATSSFTDEFVRFLAPGRYYFLTADSAAAPGDTYQVTSTLTAQVPSPIVIGTPVTTAALPATGSAFYTFDFGTNIWDSIAAAATNGGAEVQVSPYLLTGAGWLDNGYNSVGSFTFDAAGGDVFEHIFFGDTNDYLIRVTTTAPTAGTTYDLAINSVPYVDLGALSSGTPLDRAGDAFGDDEFQRYLATAGAGSITSITASPNTASPTIDIIMESLPDTYATAPLLRNVSPYLIRADAGFDGDPETLTSGVNGYIAFAVGDYFGDAGTVDLHIVTESPQPYDITSGAIAFTSICPSLGGSGTVLTMSDDGSGFGALDEGLSSTQTMPFAFDLHGEPVTNYVVSTNGWLTFDPSTIISPGGGGLNGAEYSDRPLPFATDANGMVAPYWYDMVDDEVCSLVAGSTVTIEWTGVSFSGSLPMSVQVVLHDSGVIDYIYGSGHTATGNASVGIENLAASFGHAITPEPAAGTSVTLTPAP